MKNTIIISAITLTTVLSSYAASDYVIIQKVTSVDEGTKVSFTREYDHNLLMSGDYTLEGKPTLQAIVDKVAMRCDNNITTLATSTLGSTTPKAGTVQDDAMARMNAWHKGGIAGYLVELARQLDLMK